MIVRNCGHLTQKAKYFKRNGYSNVCFQQPKHKYPKHRIQCKSDVDARHYSQFIHKAQFQLKREHMNLLLNTEYDESIDELMEDMQVAEPVSLANRWRNMESIHKVMFILVSLTILCLFWLGFTIKDEYFSAKVRWNLETQVEYGNTKFTPFELRRTEAISSIDLDVFELGKQTVQVEYLKDGERILEKKQFTVIDTKAPVITLDESLLVSKIGEQPNYEELGIHCEDPIDGDTSYQIKKIDADKIGRQEGLIVAEDIHGNQTKKRFTLIVEGVGDAESISMYQKQRVALKKEYEERKQKEKDEAERKALIESLGIDNLSESTLQWALEVHRLNEKIWDTKYDALVLAVMEVESGGTACDLLQSSEAQGGNAPGPGCGVYKDEKESLRGGILALKSAMERANVKDEHDYDAIAYGLQGYNFGPRWFTEYNEYTKTKSEKFSEKMKKELKTDVYGLIGYPEYVFRYYNPNFVFEDEDEKEEEEDKKPEEKPSKPVVPEQKPVEPEKPNVDEEEKPNGEEPNENENVGDSNSPILPEEEKEIFN